MRAAWLQGNLPFLKLVLLPDLSHRMEMKEDSEVFGG